MEKTIDTYTIELDVEFRKRFEEFCKKEHRSMAAEIRFLIEKEMREKEEQDK